MIGNCVPTLSVDGWVKDNQLIVIKLFEHYLAADANQSNLFANKIKSLKYVLLNYKEPYDISKAITEDLKVIYGKHYNNISVEVTAKEDPVDAGRLIIEVSIIVTLPNETIVLSKAIKAYNGNVENFNELASELRKYYSNS